MQRIEGILIEETLKHTGGNQQAAAERLGISRMTLRSKRKEGGGSTPQEP